MMGGILAGFPKKDCLLLKKFGFNLGLAFQILDDCLDLAPRNTRSGKDSYRDLPEGKVTLPVLLMLKRLSPAARRRLEPVLFSKKAGDKKRILAALEETEAIPRSLAEVESLLVQGQKILDRVPRLKYHKELRQLVLLFKNPLVN
jgi:geranylgeranyl pyrophosphate synthase